ncbi:hypothetical protein [Streptomyces sioyaensis]|uniref:hypothetical protein n=1 Tax=Streptomyces sioyaensis TaxID=67364 RepID=UPI003EBEAB40
MHPSSRHGSADNASNAPAANSPTPPGAPPPIHAIATSCGFAHAADFTPCLPTSQALSSDEAVVPMREVGFQAGDGVPRQLLAVSGT